MRKSTFVLASTALASIVTASAGAVAFAPLPASISLAPDVSYPHASYPLAEHQPHPPSSRDFADLST
ncbi:MAG: hypothetical protein ABW137_27825 [Mycobacterium sp.]